MMEQNFLYSRQCFRSSRSARPRTRGYRTVLSVSCWRKSLQAQLTKDLHEVLGCLTECCRVHPIFCHRHVNERLPVLDATPVNWERVHLGDGLEELLLACGRHFRSGSRMLKGSLPLLRSNKQAGDNGSRREAWRKEQEGINTRRCMACLGATGRSIRICSATAALATWSSDASQTNAREVSRLVF